MTLYPPGGMGDAYANFIRQLAISGRSSWKVIGYRIGSNHGLLNTPDLITDGPNVFFELASLKLKQKQDVHVDGDFVEESFKIGELRGGLPSKYFDVSGDLSVVCQEGHENVDFHVFYRFGRGTYEFLENESFILNNSNIFTKSSGVKFTAISSGHSDSVIRTEVRPGIENDTVVITSSVNEDMGAIMMECIRVLQNMSET